MGGYGRFRGKWVKKKKKQPANTVFSLNFSSAGKGPFMASKEKNIHQEAHFPGGSQLSFVKIFLVNLQAVAGSKKCCFRW